MARSAREAAGHLGSGDDVSSEMVSRPRQARSNEQARHTARAEQERKQRVLTKGHPAMVDSIADAVTVKNLNLYYVIAPNGQLPLEGDHGFGLYFHDCRFLDGYEMQLGGHTPVALASTAQAGSMALFELTNPDLYLGDDQLVPKEELGIRWERHLEPEQQRVRETMTVRNLGQDVCHVPLTLRFRARFDDVFAVRELVRESLGTPEPPRWRNGRLQFTYRGADRVRRTTLVAFSPAPDEQDDTEARFFLRLQPGDARAITIAIELKECAEGAATGFDRQTRGPAFEPMAQRGPSTPADGLGPLLELESDSLLLNGVVDRSLRDLRMLRSRLGDKEYFAAGVPWFVALFGRDSLIVALETLAFQPDIAAQTLRLLASYQGRENDAWRDEQPGMILHELRVGELAGAGEIPHTPFYGTVDATPLFLLLMARHAAWTGDLALFRELREPVERALAWIASAGDSDADGYLKYCSKSDKGLINQGWKDSGNAIVRADGTLARPPIALVEVQGYVFAAKRSIADLYRRAGEPDRAEALCRQAEALRARFNRDFWSDELGTFVLALEADARPVSVVSSNPGHALWAGIADEDKARRTVQRLMAQDMFSGWGVRTLSSDERGYNPVGYHLGTVWPHDNAIFAAGCRRYGEDEAALRILTATAEAAMHFRHQSLPEVMAGFRREDFQVPVPYPVACHPQAWAAGAVPFLVTTCLGLEPDAFAGKLRIMRPGLPDFVDRIVLRGLRIGQDAADLDFRRTSDGIAVDVVRTTGRLSVDIET